MASFMTPKAGDVSDRVRASSNSSAIQAQQCAPQRAALAGNRMATRMILSLSRLQFGDEQTR